MNFFKHKYFLPIMFCIGVFTMLNTYFLTKYEIFDYQIKEVSLETNANPNDLLIYVLPLHAEGYDYSHPIKGKRLGYKNIFAIKNLEIRAFRVYIGRKDSNNYIKDVEIANKQGLHKLPLSKLKMDKVNVSNKKNSKIFLFANETNGYFENQKYFISKSEFIVAELLILFFSIITGSVIWKLILDSFMEYIKLFSLKQFLVILFIMTIFLPPPIANILFIASFIFILPQFDSKLFLKNKIGLVIISYFLITVINNIIMNQAIDVKFIETILPMLFIPIYFSCLQKFNFIKSLIYVSVLLSLYLIYTSFVDFLIYLQPGRFSFDNFAKYIHPIYLSYLLSFSIIYLLIIKDKFKYRHILFVILITSLICCGSKLVIGFTVCIGILELFKSSKALGVGLSMLILVAVFLFGPTKNRFKEVLNTDSLSILSENPIVNNKDPRLNGVTLRIILWQEAIGGFSGIKEVLFGHGTSNEQNSSLKNSLLNRGLTTGHANYDPHNQFIATLYKTGLIGLFLLIILCVISFREAFLSRNRLWVYITVLFTISMLTESILQRALGIYFFCILLVFEGRMTMINYEDSDTGD